MAKTIKFNLVCDGNSVRTLEDLRNNFLIEDVIEYYKNGLLLRWLKVRGFDDEYKKVNAIREHDDISIIKKLTDIFGMEVEESEIEESIYILQYEYKRKASLDRYRNSSNNLESMIDKHIQEYNRFVNFIINNNYDKPKIKAAPIHINCLPYLWVISRILLWLSSYTAAYILRHPIKTKRVYKNMDNQSIFFSNSACLFIISAINLPH